MIRNYLKIAWRNLFRHKAHTFINIAGLSLGMAVVMLISLWIYDEVSFDKYFQNHDSIVLMRQNQTFNGTILTQTSLPIPLGYKLRGDFKDDFKYVVLTTPTNPHVIAFGDKKLNQGGNFMQADAPYLFTFKMLKGSRSGLNDPSSILICASLAKSLFGFTDPINKVIKLDHDLNVKVTGVYEDFPKNTTLYDMNFVAPWDLYMTTMPWLKQAATKWGNNSWSIFAQLNPNADINKVNAKIKNLKLDGLKAQNDMVGISFKPAIFMQPMSHWHLYDEYKNGVNTGGKIEFVWMFGIIGLFVLVLACINFMNLSTARSEKRAKEVGIRKTLGSLRQQLIGQFFVESLLITFFSFVSSVLLVQLVLPWFNGVADKNLVILWNNLVFWLIGIGFSLFTGILAGSYPAFYLSSFQPVKVLKGTFKTGRFAALPRKVLVVLQFTVSVTLIIGTVVVFRQVQFTKNRPVGYNRNGLLQIMNQPPIHVHFEAVRNDLLKSGAISQIAESGSPVTGVWSNYSGLSWRGKSPGQQDDFGMVDVKPDYGKTIGWHIIQGRDFLKDMLTDSSGIVLNESAVKYMNFKNPIGEIVNWRKNYKVIGVVSDLVMSSPYTPVKPTIFYMRSDAGGIINIKINPTVSTHDAISKIAAVFTRYDSESPFDYSFADTDYAKKFADEERIGNLAAFFTILAIFISCLGLFGMASFMAEQRTKEIGVRKVLGASVLNLWSLMSWNFVILIGISILIAMPTAYYFMQGWLKKYTYHAELSWWIFAATAIASIVITLLTVSFQAIKAALANPVNSLRSE